MIPAPAAPRDFAVPGAVLVSAGMSLYLWSVATRGE